MPDELCEAIKEKLTELGYVNVEGNCGVVYYSDGNETWCISECLCEKEEL